VDLTFSFQNITIYPIRYFDEFKNNIYIISTDVNSHRSSVGEPSRDLRIYVHQKS
jgi:hypothetical protein